MCVIEDYSSLWFTIQSILLHHPEVSPLIEFVVIDNDPTTVQGAATKKFCENWVKKVPIQYIPFDEYKATSLRNKIFDYARTDYVMVCDSHVLFPPGAIKKLIDFFESGQDNGNLIQGPLIVDNLSDVCTHFEPEWRAKMLGFWNYDAREKTEESFEIPGQGFGVFACRKDSWLRICDDNKFFGGEEISINRLYNYHNKKTLCLSSLRWLHKFRYQGEILPYDNSIEDRIKNYFREFKRFEGNPQEIIDHFVSEGISLEDILLWQREI